MPESHGRHHGQRETDACLHFGLATDEVPLKTEAGVNAVVDTFQGAAPMVTTPPGGTVISTIRNPAVELPGDMRLINPVEGTADRATCRLVFPTPES